MKGMIFFLVAALSSGTAYALAPPDEECNEPIRLDEWPAGIACEFPLTVLACEVKDFKPVDDKLIQAGRAAKLFVTNEETGTTKLLRPRGGSLVQIIPKDDGTTRLVATGINLVILFPTDNPPGPSANLHKGRVDVIIDQNGDWTVQKASGTITDVCALLGG
jgi:hypothetical protein